MNKSLPLRKTMKKSLELIFPLLHALLSLPILFLHAPLRFLQFLLLFFQAALIFLARCPVLLLVFLLRYLDLPFPDRLE